MKKIAKISCCMLTLAFLVGCGKPQIYGNAIDWSKYETDDFHVCFTMGEDDFYSDGSFNAEKDAQFIEKRQRRKFFLEASIE